MTQNSEDILISTSWITVAVVLAIVAGVGSAIGWTVAAGVALVPPVALLWLRDKQGPIMPQRIRVGVK